MLKDIDRQWVESTWIKLKKKLKAVTVRCAGIIPYTTDENGVYIDWAEEDINWWTNGFWGGIMWLMYISTDDKMYLSAAENSENLLDKALKNIDRLDHDVGFMWLLTAVAHYKVTKNPVSRNRGLFAASLLASRFNLKGGFIRAWNGKDNAGFSIIDCMMNLPLLYWASNEINDDRFFQIAQCCADKAIQNHLRHDASVRHIVQYNSYTGEVEDELCGQGYAKESSWSRGQAWALYGFALSYRHTKDPEHLNAAKRVAHYFIACACDDFLPKCDFRSPASPTVYDSTAGAIAASGLIEIAENVSEYEKEIYLHAALQLLRAMESTHCNWNTKNDAIVTNATESYHNCKWHIPIIYGDYFFLEAVCKLRGLKISLW